MTHAPVESPADTVYSYRLLRNWYAAFAIRTAHEETPGRRNLATPGVKS
ncbi:n-acylglucosamine 2-epimerase [Paraburkholderia caribensis MBA4]|uniref:N-acylglucosamine 2-epimerase n=1 Tax=Paraburkholderia caribensis MBA4 TaxID=1323664 RepID=A0A0P0RE30_9BURK|nr:n-acylglucosamine 2-epimerase [Paraburkholderia caribensis MBA4]